jgi:uncharacterized protein (UPF0332 family)
MFYNLMELGLIQPAQLEELINEMAKERFKKGQAYIEFARNLDVNISENQAHIVSRNYYGMYHLARATVFHTRRRDIDDHDRLPEAFGQIVGVSFEEKLEKWRDVRNVLEYSPYTPTDIVTICFESMSDAQEILTRCRQYLKGRGVDLENS